MTNGLVLYSTNTSPASNHLGGEETGKSQAKEVTCNGNEEGMWFKRQEGFQLL